MTLHFLGNNAGGLYNISTGKARSCNDLVKATFAAMNIKPEITYVDMPESIRNQYQYYTCGDNSKILAAGYKGKAHSREEAIENYVTEFLATSSYLMP